jgi:LCP family protein required for cell wall assembly
MRRRRGVVRILAGRMAIALCLSTVCMVGAVLTVNYVIDAKLSHVARVGLRTAAATSGPENFLVVGSDTRAFTNGSSTLQQQFGTAASNGGQRSDTMMVIRIDPSHSKTLVVSFPRDLWVQVPGLGVSKINSAYDAGPQHVIDMLKQDFNISINHFVQVDFKSFQGVVNSIGSVPVYVPYQARDNLTGLYQPIAGCEQFDGADALAYVRSRELEYYSQRRQEWLPADAVPDIDRIARQQQFIKTLAEVAVKDSLSNPLTANAIVDRVLENLTVDSGLSKSDVLNLVDAFRSINPGDTGHVEFATLPWTEGPNQDGQNVLYVRQPDADALLARLGGATNPTEVSVNGVAPLDTTGASGSTSTTTTPSTTTTTAPPTPSQSGTPGAAPTAPIADQSIFGTPAPKAKPC